MFLRDDGAEDAVGERLELLAGLGAGVRAAEVVRRRRRRRRRGCRTCRRDSARRFRVAVPAVAGLAGERVEVVRRRFLQGFLRRKRPARALCADVEARERGRGQRGGRRARSRRHPRT